MNINVPAPNHIGVEVSDIDVSTLGKNTIEDVKKLLYQHKLVIFRDQDISMDDYIEFAKKLGTPQVYFQDNYHHPDHPEIFVSSNVPENGKKVGVPGTGRYWHTDCSFQEKPLSLTLLYPQQLPQENRETYYINMQRVYDILPDDLKVHTHEAKAVHDGKWRYKIQEIDVDRAIIDILKDVSEMAPAVIHPMVIDHPVTQEKILYISRGFTTAIADLSHEESERILNQLLDFTEQENNIHTHRWKDGDILLWDNRPLVHKASIVSKGEPSVSYRIGVYDGLPFYTNGHRVLTAV